MIRPSLVVVALALNGLSAGCGGTPESGATLVAGIDRPLTPEALIDGAFVA